MSLETCSVCGYAVSSADGHCRHCPPAFTRLLGFQWKDAGLIWRIVAGVAVVGVTVWILISGR